MPNMIIKIDVLKKDKKSVLGGTSIDINWKPNENYAGPLINTWSVWDFNSMFNFELFWDEFNGLFDNKSWDVMWLWVRNPDNRRLWKNVFILWNPPTSKHDNSHMKGEGRIYEAKNPSYSGLNLKWRVKCLAGCFIN